MITHIINKHLPANFFEKLHGCNIVIHCIDLNKTWYCMIEAQLHIVDSQPDTVDLEISSTFAGFLQFILNQDRSGLHLKGNLAVAETVQNLWAKLDIDWEEELSKYTGDVVAHQVMRLLRSIPEIEFKQMLGEYLQEESRLLPTKYETQEFLQAVDDLRADVDRLEARIKQHAIHS